MTAVTVEARGYAALGQAEPLVLHDFQRRDVGPRDVRLEVLYCGICHSDLHFVDNDWGISRYPVVPGHEIVGRVAEVGQDVTRHRVGDLVGIGCLINSCRECEPCKSGEEQACLKRATPTYGGVERGDSGLATAGGYSDCYVVDEDFALRIPEGLDPAAAAPLLCAGITTYSPLRRAGVGPGTRVGVVGLGGLGHLGLRLAAAMGAEVTAITTSPAKAADARRLGADHVVVSNDRDQMRERSGSLDVVLDTVSALHDLHGELGLLRRGGTLCLVGMPAEPAAVSAMALASGRRSITASTIGGIAETQELLDFCAVHGVVADIETIAAADINDAYSRLRTSDVKYRFVIDLATLS
jgi:uncharacterized zinc-type alcohol dehydrogenase-like protein